MQSIIKENNMKKKVWFITGASSGLGRALAEEVLAIGDRVIATARDAEALRELVEKYPNTARAIKLDVTNKANVKEAINEAVEQFGRLDVVVNNAGYGLLGPIEFATDDEFQRRPRPVHGAHLDVNHTARKGLRPYHVFGDIGWNFRGFLGP